MRIVTNEKLVKRNTRTAQLMFFGTLGLLAIGFVLVNATLFIPNLDPSVLILVSLVMPMFVLPLAFFLTLLSIRMTNRWARQPRPERLLEDNLKGLGKQSVLYNYFHFPARHVLIAPQGVFAIITRYQEGKYTVNDEKWTTQRSTVGRVLGAIRMDGIGNPNLEARAAAEHVNKLLKDINPDVPVYPVVMFTDPRAQIALEDPAVPVVHALTRRSPNLKDLVKSLPKADVVMTQAQIEAFEAATAS